MKVSLNRLVRPLIFVVCFGLLIWMILQAGPAQLWSTLCSMPGTIVLCVGVWGIGYLLNAASFREVLTGQGQPVAFGCILRLTVTGYAINYVTPFGLLGGEPYRVLELRPLMGAEKATRSVALYSSMHIASHFCFWALAAAVGACTLEDGAIGSAGSSIPAPFMALSLTAVLGLFDWRHLPLVSRYKALSYEFVSRMVNVLEYQFIMQTMGFEEFGYVKAFLCVAFSSLFANVLFFSPMQMGTREGGILLSLQYLLPQLPSHQLLTVALSLSFATRIREVIWIFVGMLGMHRKIKA